MRPPLPKTVAKSPVEKIHENRPCQKRSILARCLLPAR
jgi:hypothetical protein